MSVRTRTTRTTTPRRREHPRSATWHTAKWANGPAAALWIDTHIDPQRIGACGQSNTIGHWRKGRRVSFWAADRVLVALGLHVAQLPEDVWVA